jgi:hypothetical protein
MPLEGHWQRTNTPLRRLTARERNVVVAGLAVTVAVVLGLILFSSAGDSHPAPAAGCFNTVVAGRTGGETVHGCGEEAKELCTHSAEYEDPRAEKVLASCREAGIEFAGPSANSAAHAQG